MTTSAVHTAAATAALAFAIMFCCSSVHHDALAVALLSFDNFEIILVFLLHTLAGARAVAVATLVRHG